MEPLRIITAAIDDGKSLNMDLEADGATSTNHNWHKKVSSKQMSNYKDRTMTLPPVKTSFGQVKESTGQNELESPLTYSIFPILTPTHSNQLENPTALHNQTGYAETTRRAH